jgi:hypothetical protein
MWLKAREDKEAREKESRQAKTSEIRGKTPHGEITIDKLAEIQPGMSWVMREVSARFYYAYYAAKGGNWSLADHELNGVRTAFKIAKVTRPKFAQDLDAFDSRFLVPIFEAVREKDWEKFADAFENGVEPSDEYHDKTGNPFIRFVLPKEPPSGLHFGPMEKFRRERGGSAGQR